MLRDVSALAQLSVLVIVIVIVIIIAIRSAKWGPCSTQLVKFDKYKGKEENSYVLVEIQI